MGFTDIITRNHCSELIRMDLMNAQIKHGGSNYKLQTCIQPLTINKEYSTWRNEKR